MSTITATDRLVYKTPEASLFHILQSEFNFSLRESREVVNVAHEIDSAYPTVNPEKVVEWNPDFILLGYMSAVQTREDFARRIGWRDIPAVRSGSIIDDVSPDLLLRPGPRLVHGVRQLSQRFHGVPAKGDTAP